MTEEHVIEQAAPFQRVVCRWVASDPQATQQLLVAALKYKQASAEEKENFVDPYDEFDRNTVAWQLLKMGYDRPMLIGIGLPGAVLCNIGMAVYFLSKAIIYFMQG